MDVAVIGGGIQGTCVALELAGRGCRVELLEARDALMRGASRDNEGKIHLGFVYANDESLATARLMSLAASRFAPLLGGWLQRDASSLAVSRPFLYAVHRHSLLDAGELAARYEAIAGLVRGDAALPGADYFKVREPHRVRRLARHEVSRHFDPSAVCAAFETEEVAVDPDAVADLLVERVLGDPRIRVRTGARVATARHVPGGVSLALEGEGPRGRRYDHVVNCAWCGRLEIDATIGVRPEHPWSFRRKYFLRLPAGRAGERVPSATVVLGGFGDVVRYASGELFLSWYPAGCRGIELGLSPGAEGLGGAQAGAVREGIVRGLGAVVPMVLGAAAELPDAPLRGGVIFALGTTDVDDRRSMLHRRHEVGPRSFGRYHTVDTGKYTLAPLFARRLADSILCAQGAA